MPVNGDNMAGAQHQRGSSSIKAAMAAYRAYQRSNGSRWHSASSVLAKGICTCGRGRRKAHKAAWRRESRQSYTYGSRQRKLHGESGSSVIMGAGVISFTAVSLSEQNMAK